MIPLENIYVRTVSLFIIIIKNVIAIAPNASYFFFQFMLISFHSVPVDALTNMKIMISKQKIS